MPITEPRIETLLKIIDTIPAWTAGRYDEEKTRLLLAAATQLAGASMNEVRRTIVTYADRYRLSDEPTSKLSRLYLLLRVIFDLPRSISRDKAKVFGGWNHPSVGSRDPMFWLSWPIEVDDTGRVTVVGVYDSYRGRPYDAVGEFDYFTESYKLREIKS